MANAQICVEEEHKVGSTCLIESMSPVTAFAVIFEDDGTAAHFHGLDTSDTTLELDLLHIYDVQMVEDKKEPIQIRIIWSDDGYKAALTINGRGHGVFDFEARRAYCRNNKPKQNSSWTRYDHEWSDEVEALFD